jgi:hypothetical protein
LNEYSHVLLLRDDLEMSDTTIEVAMLANITYCINYIP